jgi:hypothetical protein
VVAVRAALYVSVQRASAALPQRFSGGFASSGSPDRARRRSRRMRTIPDLKSM